MNKKLLVLGKGFIGTRLAEGLNCPVSKEHVYSLRDIETIIWAHKPDVLINCIGYTGEKNTDDCDKQPDKTLTANTFVPIMLAEASIRYGFKLIQIGSGCIYHFDYEWQNPLPEGLDPDFFDLFYSRTKIYTERALGIFSSWKYNILIPRIRIPLDNILHPKNILTKLLGYEKVISLPNSITYIPDFIQALKHLIEVDAIGIYNVVNEGSVTWPEILNTYNKFALASNMHMYEVIDSEDLGLKRTNLLLSTKKLKDTGFEMRNIFDVLAECVKTYIGNEYK